MTDILDLVADQLDSNHVEEMSRAIGADTQQTKTALGALLPTMIGALASNSAETDGENRMHQALIRDHDGSILEHLGELFSEGKQVPESSGINPKTTMGESILEHIFGGQKPKVEERVGSASGLSSGQVIKLMMMVAPLLMGVLGRKQKQDDLSPGGLGDLLRQNERRMESQIQSRDQPSTQASEGGSLLGRMLDRDGDGDFDMMDMVKIGTGKLFGGK